MLGVPSEDAEERDKNRQSKKGVGVESISTRDIDSGAFHVFRVTCFGFGFRCKCRRFADLREWFEGLHPEGIPSTTNKFCLSNV